MIPVLLGLKKFSPCVKSNQGPFDWQASALTTVAKSVKIETNVAELFFF